MQYGVCFSNSRARLLTVIPWLTEVANKEGNHGTSRWKNTSAVVPGGIVRVQEDNKSL